ncbi:MAG: L,D-transpeptidase family protein [Candidatus Omnitrophota bacterium]|nr:L,D-transpeptidase family protein [Candidatus Omnitrophota bacterium]
MKNKILVTSVALVLVTVLAIFLFSKIRCPLSAKNTGAALELYNQAIGLEAKGEVLSAKNDLQKLTEEFPNFKLISEAQKKLEDINLRILFSSLATPQTKLCEVKPGDSLDKIARAFNTTVELIKKSNNLSANTIRPGQKLRIWTEKFSILVDKSQNTLILKSGDEIIKTYRVSTGLNNSTPVGVFKITSKLVNPPWFKAGAVVPPESPENVLGSRWMGFDIPGYGIHGTIQPETIGQQITAGCVRMKNLDVEELYSIVPQGAEVTIVD